MEKSSSTEISLDAILSHNVLQMKERTQEVRRRAQMRGYSPVGDKLLSRHMVCGEPWMGSNVEALLSLCFQ